MRQKWYLLDLTKVTDDVGKNCFNGEVEKSVLTAEEEQITDAEVGTMR